MPEFIAVQCFQCKHYQVGQKRKDGKFNCKLCGSKQSVRKIMARSNKAADVRKFVQHINLTRGQAEESFDDLHRADADGGCSDEDADYNEYAGDMGNCAVQGPWEDPYGNREDTRDGQSEDRGHSQSRSKWAPYDSVLAQRERAHPGCGVTEAGDGSVYDDEVGEEDFVTALPDNRSGGKEKGKRRGRRECATPTTSKRRGFATANNMNKDDVEGGMARCKGLERHWEPQHRSTTAVLEKNDGHGRQNQWNQWDDAAPPPRIELQGDDFGDGTFTSLGQDEVVNEEVQD